MRKNPLSNLHLGRESYQNKPTKCFKFLNTSICCGNVFSSAIEVKCNCLQSCSEVK